MNEFDEQWAKMLAGEIYDAAHSGFGNRLSATRSLLWKLNNLKPDLFDEQRISTSICRSDAITVAIFS